MSIWFLRRSGHRRKQAARSPGRHDGPDPSVVVALTLRQVHHHRTPPALHQEDPALSALAGVPIRKRISLGFGVSGFWTP